MPDATAYARFSPRPSPGDCDSVEKQLERCRAYCLGHGYNVISEHFDKDLSGGAAHNRPGLQAAIELACQSKAVLVVYSLSRLARCTRDAIDLAERLNKAGADLAVIQECVNTRSPMGRFVFTIFSALAQLEREQIVDRTSSAMLRHQANGRRMGRLDRCPWGMMADLHGPTVQGKDGLLRPARMIENPEEQATIACILAEREKGRSARVIAEEMDRAGIDCRGRRWSQALVASILRRAVHLRRRSAG